MHEECIKEAALRDTYNRLGTSKPHLPPEPVKEEKNEDEAKRPLSPTETGAAVSAQHSIDVKADGGSANGLRARMNDNVEVKQADDEDAHAAPEDSPPEPPTTRRKGEAGTSAKSTPAKPTPGRKPGRPRKKPAEPTGDGLRPWEGLFEVTLKTDAGSSKDEDGPILELRDLRQGIVGGEKTWTVPVKCLVCDNRVH